MTHAGIGLTLKLPKSGAAKQAAKGVDLIELSAGCGGFNDRLRWFKAWA